MYRATTAAVLYPICISFHKRITYLLETFVHSLNVCLLRPSLITEAGTAFTSSLCTLSEFSVSFFLREVINTLAGNQSSTSEFYDSFFFVREVVLLLSVTTAIFANDFSGKLILKRD